MFNYILQVLEIFGVFNFRSVCQVQKIFRNENFPNYRYTLPIQYMKYASILASSYSGINHKKQVLVCMSITVQENSQPLVQCMLMR